MAAIVHTHPLPGQHLTAQPLHPFFPILGQGVAVGLVTREIEQRGQSQALQILNLLIYIEGVFHDRP